MPISLPDVLKQPAEQTPQRPPTWARELTTWAQERDRRHADITEMLEQMFVGDFFLNNEGQRLSDDEKLPAYLRGQFRYTYEYHFPDIDREFFKEVVWVIVQQYVHKLGGKCSAHWVLGDKLRIPASIYITWKPPGISEEFAATYWEGWCR